MNELPPIPSDPADLKAWVESLSRGDLMALAQQVTSGAFTAGLGLMGEFGLGNREIDLPPPPDEPSLLTLTIELRWLWVDREGSRPGYRDMQVFIASLDDAQTADRLDRAIRRRGAFRQFKDTLSAWPDLMTRWYAFSEDRQRGRARAWLADAGYAAVPTTLRG